MPVLGVTFHSRPSLWDLLAMSPRPAPALSPLQRCICHGARVLPARHHPCLSAPGGADGAPPVMTDEFSLPAFRGQGASGRSGGQGASEALAEPVAGSRQHLGSFVPCSIRAGAAPAMEESAFGLIGRAFLGSVEGCEGLPAPAGSLPPPPMAALSQIYTSGFTHKP